MRKRRKAKQKTEDGVIIPIYGDTKSKRYNTKQRAKLRIRRIQEVQSANDPVLPTPGEFLKLWVTMLKKYPFTIWILSITIIAPTLIITFLLFKVLIFTAIRLFRHFVVGYN